MGLLKLPSLVILRSPLPTPVWVDPSLPTTHSCVGGQVRIQVNQKLCVAVRYGWVGRDRGVTLECLPKVGEGV